MSKKVFFGQNDLRYYYLRFKDSKYYSLSLYLMIIVICLILIIAIIIPQVRDYLSIRERVFKSRESISNINSNINFINSLDKNELNQQLQVLSSGLPPDKNFVGIINVLSEASIRAGVTLSDFNFSLGKIASNSSLPNDVSSQQGEADDNSDEPVILDEVSSENGRFVKTTVIIDGSIDRLGLFLKELEAKIPLSEAINFSTERNSTTISLNFYYEPFQDVTFIEDVVFEPISDEDRLLINTISEWQSKAPVGDPFLDQSGSTPPLFE